MSTRFNLRGKMTLTIHSARGLAVKELIGKMDPYAVAHISGSKDEKFKTKVAQDQHQTPVWEQSYIFNLEGKEEILHVNVWNQATLGDDHIGRLDLTLDGLDMSGKPAWYQLKDKQNFSKQTGEVRMSVVFEGTGLPDGSLAAKTNAQRINPVSPAAGVASPATPQIVAAPVQQVASPQPQVMAAVGAPPPQQQQQAPRIAYGNPPAAQQSPQGYPGAVAQQQYASGQPNYQQQPQQQYQQPPQQQYQQQPQQFQQQQQYHSPQQPMYQAPQQPMYQAAPAPVYQQAPMQPVYQSQPAPVVYQSQPAAVVFQQPGISFQPAQPVFVQAQPQPQLIYHQPQQQAGQLIGYWPNGQPRYA